MVGISTFRLFLTLSICTVSVQGFSVAPLLTSNKQYKIGGLAFHGNQFNNAFDSMGSFSKPLKMSTETKELDGTTDPIAEEVELIKSMDMNAIINTAVIVGCSIAVLSKLATVDLDIMRGWTAAEMAVRIPVDNFLGYSSILDKAPVETKAITSATVYTIGDFISQRTEGKEIGDLDRGRIIRSLLAGLIGHGPMSHVWYDWSEGIFNDVFHWTEWWGFVPKVAVDQVLWGPLWNNTYIILLGLMKLENPSIIWSDVKRTTIPLVVSGLKLWPLAHCVTYGLMPVQYRLLWVDLVEIIWVTILSTQAAGGAAEGEAKAADAK